MTSLSENMELAGKYLTFKLAGEEYGIKIRKIKEIIGMMPVTKVPRTPEFAVGVINLRGKVIPVLDVRRKFGMAAIDYTDRTCIVVVEIDKENSIAHVGCIVDAVSEVLNIDGRDIEGTPDFGTRLESDYILGMAKFKQTVKILLDIDRVLCAGEISIPEETKVYA